MHRLIVDNFFQLDSHSLVLFSYSFRNRGLGIPDELFQLYVGVFGTKFSTHHQNRVETIQSLGRIAFLNGPTAVCSRFDLQTITIIAKNYMIY
jgi:hypothetical protein